MLFCQQTHERQKYHLVTAEPPFAVKKDWVYVPDST